MTDVRILISLKSKKRISTLKSSIFKMSTKNSMANTLNFSWRWRSKKRKIKTWKIRYLNCLILFMDHIFWTTKLLKIWLRDSFHLKLNLNCSTEHLEMEKMEPASTIESITRAKQWTLLELKTVISSENTLKYHRHLLMGGSKT